MNEQHVIGLSTVCIVTFIVVEHQDKLLPLITCYSSSHPVPPPPSFTKYYLFPLFKLVRQKIKLVTLMIPRNDKILTTSPCQKMQGYNFDFYKVLKMQNKRLPTEYIIF